MKESLGLPTCSERSLTGRDAATWSGTEGSGTEGSGTEGSSEITEAFFTLRFHPFNGRFPGLGSKPSLLP